jgi:peptidyl-prolyl cis-trans isomerase A (cyclophilin A)
MKRTSLFALSLLLVSCLDKPPGNPEPTPVKVGETGGGGTSSTPADEPPPQEPPAVVKRVDSPDGKDPLKGSFSLAQATEGLAGSGALTANIRTSRGQIQCKLFEDKAPNTVANFVGLARGVRPFKFNNAWVLKPAYDGTTFHRIIQGFMIQGGDPEGTGAGDPGYVIADEIWPGSTHDHPGQLCMANRGKNTNGMQFFITDAAVKRLDGNYTIFGDCTPHSTVRAIAASPKGDLDRPDRPITIYKIEITRSEQ